MDRDPGTTLRIRPRHGRARCDWYVGLETLRDLSHNRALGTTRHTLATTLVDRPAEAAAKIEICIAADAAKCWHRRTARAFTHLFRPARGGICPSRLEHRGRVVDRRHGCASAPEFHLDHGNHAERFRAPLGGLSRFNDVLRRSPPYTLMPPRPDELAEIIREPAKAAGLIWEQRDGVALDQELLRDATGNPESLPLLEYTLADLYERREGRLLRWSDYGGGLRGALISAADEVVTGAAGDVDVAFRDVMRELVGVGEDGAGTRRYASLTRFAGEARHVAYSTGWLPADFV